MTSLLVMVLILLSGGFLALLMSKRWTLSLTIGTGSAIVGLLTGLYFIGRQFFTGCLSQQSYMSPWAMPFGLTMEWGTDALSTFFLFPLLILALVSTVYGYQYLSHYRGHKTAGPICLFYNLLLSSMVGVLLARSVIAFLLSWEVMAISSYFLVCIDHENRRVQDAGWLYLIATHVGTAFIILMFLLLARSSGSLSFETFVRQATGVMPPSANLLFLLAVIGFGTKAGFMPLHIWLPEAHPAAPSHVSALMSGIMIKTGIYALLRTLTFLGPTPPETWAWCMIGIGAISGILGILWALGQHDIKRLLAYSSIENIGIIAMAIGVGLLGLTRQSPFMAAAGFAAALLHTLNHTLFKGLLFLGAGAIYTTTKTRNINQLGGLLKRMPWTGFAFLIGSAAICGLPPFNGFISEFLLYATAFHGVLCLSTRDAIPLLFLIASLSLIGGLAIATYTKVYGIIFLGEPRSPESANASEVPTMMKLPLGFLAILCVSLGFFAPWTLKLIQPSLGVIMPHLPGGQGALMDYSETLGIITAVFVVLVAMVCLLMWYRHVLLKHRRRDYTVTWDCGYARPNPRMQYTASSFAQPLMDVFIGFMRRHRRIQSPTGYFPSTSKFDTDTRDLFRERLFVPFFHRMNKLLSLLRWVQQGRIQLYVLYIVITLIAVLIWSLRGMHG